MFVLDPISFNRYPLKEAVSTVLSARIRLGHTIYHSHRDLNRGLRGGKISVSQYVRALAFSYPGLAPRTFFRCYKIYEKLVIQCGLWPEWIEEVDFTILSKVAEAKIQIPYVRRQVIYWVLAKMRKEENYALISRGVDRILANLRKNPGKIPAALQAYDKRLVDVGMEFGLTDVSADE